MAKKADKLPKAVAVGELKIGELGEGTPGRGCTLDDDFDLPAIPSSKRREPYISADLTTTLKNA